MGRWSRPKERLSAQQIAKDRETILANWQLIDVLRQYALGSGVLPPPREPFDRPTWDYLNTPDGVELVRKWLVALSSSVGLIEKFRNVLVHSPISPSDDDIHDVAESSGEMLDALSARVHTRIESGVA